MFFFSQNSNFVFKSNSIEFAYLSILNDDLSRAKSIFSSIDSSRAKWGKALVGILEGYLDSYPTYFQIRNYIEIDLDFLIKNSKIDYVELLLGSTEHLIITNQETYKYIARALYENNFYKIAKVYMDKSKEIFYNDPELHFIYAKYFININNLRKALFYINECLKIVPNYYPAILLKEKILLNLA